jgi:hypothetical protein
LARRRPDSKTEITDLHSFSDTPAPINVSEKSSVIIGKDAPVEEQNQKLKTPTRGPSISPE